MSEALGFLLAQPGQALPNSQRQASISEKDLLEELREQGNAAALVQTEAVYLERNGRISVIKKST